MLNRIKNIPAFLRYKFDLFKNRVKHLSKIRLLINPIFIDGHPDSKNFGDAINISIVEYLSGKNVFPSKFIKNTKFEKSISYSVIGSISQWSRENSIIWGSGFIQESFITESFVKPYKVEAVRGPLTRNIYLNNNIDCPEVYGDPALLLPLMYIGKPKSSRYEYGIIPHYTEINSEWVREQRKRKDVLFINIMIGSDIQKFVDDLISCKKIVTSSLHGLILSHAYKIPVCHIKLSDNITGGDFKFNDYLLSVQKEYRKPFPISTPAISLESLEYDADSIKFDIKPLINSCPFIKSDVKENLLKASAYYEGS